VPSTGATVGKSAELLYPPIQTSPWESTPICEPRLVVSPQAPPISVNQSESEEAVVNLAA
jgi:hypothetical protein